MGSKTLRYQHGRPQLVESNIQSRRVLFRFTRFLNKPWFKKLALGSLGVYKPERRVFNAFHPFSLQICIFLNQTRHQDHSTVCPRSIDPFYIVPFYIVNYYIKSVTTSWTDGISKIQLVKILRIRILSPVWIYVFQEERASMPAANGSRRRLQHSELTSVAATAAGQPATTVIPPQVSEIL